MRTWLLVLLVGCTQGEPGVAQQSLRAQASAQENSPNVSIIVGPTDKGQALIDAISHATQSVHVLMYLLTDEGVQNAILDRHAQGLDVRVVLNKDVPQGVDNTRAFQCLNNRGVSVVWAPAQFDFNHSKSIVLDGKSAWIMTMNASKSSLLYNREFLAVDTTPADVAESEALFQADFADTSFSPQGSLVISPLNSRAKITDLVDNAKTSIDVMAEQLLDAKFVSALCQARARGVTVRAMTDGDTGESQLRVVKQLAQCDVPVYTLDALYVHAKAIVADGTRAYVGSVNFTRTSMDYNREVGLVTDNAAAVATIATTIDSDISVGRRIAEPMPCGTPDECAAGSACLNRFCQAYCSSGAQCHADEVCVLDKDSSYGSCQVPATCASSDECGKGLICNGACAHCSANGDCATGFCDKTFCKAPPAKKCTDDPTVCKGATPACDTTSAKCVGCNIVEFECPAQTTCDADYCSRTVGQCKPS